MNCVWGTSSKMRCSEVVLAIMHDPTRTDPFYSAAYRSFMDARRMLLKRPDRVTDLYEDLQLVKPGKFINGPAHGLVRYAISLGMRFERERGTGR